MVAAVYQPLSREEEEHFDIYRHYPVVGGRLFNNSFHTGLILMELSQIKCHFGACVMKGPTGQDWILAQPLDRVRSRLPNLDACDY